MNKEDVVNAHNSRAKSLQSCPTLCDPIPGILQARTLEWAAITEYYSLIKMNEIMPHVWT